MIGYIYKITCLNNNKVYVGQTRQTIARRWSQHKRNSKINNTPLYTAIRKYGLESFVVSTVKTVSCKTLEELKQILNQKEIYYCNKLNALHPKGYTLVAGGLSLTQEASKRIGEATALRNKTKKHRQANSKGLKAAYKNGLENKGVAAMQHWQRENSEQMLKIRQQAVIKARAKSKTKKALTKLSISNSIKYLITTPNNIQLCIIGMNNFCKKYNLDVSSMCKVAKGYRKSHKGFKAQIIS